ncbi:hypothetical protein CK203_069516 [Vitis vinifera]|uniref:Uncharacterized protein n=1 Tax=Vitis vinifera TaxID=29760 RepID=A0A438EL04_VITVI|nr:hypothetical protein CK203_069516 [Vitis vinifera]
MCILVHAVKRQSLDLPLEGRISNALVEVGPSITLASLSEVLGVCSWKFHSYAGMPCFLDVCSFGCSTGLPSASYCFLLP